MTTLTKYGTYGFMSLMLAAQVASLESSRVSHSKKTSGVGMPTKLGLKGTRKGAHS